VYQKDTRPVYKKWSGYVSIHFFFQLDPAILYSVEAGKIDRPWRSVLLYKGRVTSRTFDGMGTSGRAIELRLQRPMPPDVIRLMSRQRCPVSMEV
jgi:hypothetical protein